MSIFKRRSGFAILFWSVVLVLISSAYPCYVGADDESDAVDNAPKVTKKSPNKRSAATFDYFIRSGYAADSISDIQAIGRVAGNDGSESHYGAPQKIYIDLLDEKTELALGDSLVVFDDLGVITEIHSGFTKRLILNLAIVKVREVQKRRCLVEIVRSFSFFEKGARVKSLAREREFWNKARALKTLPDHSIKCYVASGDPGREYWNQGDYVILTGGSKQGIVEGMNFELRNTKSAEEEEAIRGKAKVFFSGPDYSVAQIISNSEGITSGFEAVYKP